MTHGDRPGLKRICLYFIADGCFGNSVSLFVVRDVLIITSVPIQVTCPAQSRANFPSSLLPAQKIMMCITPQTQRQRETEKRGTQRVTPPHTHTLTSTHTRSHISWCSGRHLASSGFPGKLNLSEGTGNCIKQTEIFPLELWGVLLGKVGNSDDGGGEGSR